jgi:hypothetical protein
MGRKLVITFVEAVDFFEDTTATFYDYSALREKYGETGILEKIAVSFIKWPMNWMNWAWPSR